ncbi:pyridoxal phosphate-dependent decarboxylase family protein [Microcella sp.]|uniref:pyridoxal phosphate-dependent decarboxylase family protein n=1 Tax=Microcella sp. TaxID=1913979 RepID=UPI00391BE815
MSDRIAEVLDELRALTARDAPTKGGRVLSYVYDTGRSDIDRVAHAAAEIVQSVNGLDPTAFPSVAALERDLIAFARPLFHGDDDVVGSVTSGGTESCLLAVKTARDVWRAQGGEGRARLLAPVTVHAAFQKAAHLFDLRLDLVPVDPATGALDPNALTRRLGPDVAIAVASAPSYPFAHLDPIATIAAHTADHGIALHVDACIGGFALPWWPDVPEWDFRIPGVTSLSADLHKYGYAPKGASILLQRGRDRHAAQYFATTRWPGYPVVNPTLLGSKAAGPMAAAWAITRLLGAEGYGELIDRTRVATERLVTAVTAIPGVRVMGTPTGPLFALAADTATDARTQVDPHHLADAVRRRGFVLQQQPGLAQSDGTRLPPTTHLTITPVTADAADDLIATITDAGDEVRGRPAADPTPVLAALSSADPSDALNLLGLRAGELPAEQATLTALIEALPHDAAEGILVSLLQSLIDPNAASE